MLYRKFYGLTKHSYRLVQHFPKQYKYTLGENILSLHWQCLDLVMEANAADKRGKAGKIEELSLEFDKLKLRLRMAQEVEIISAGQFAHLQTTYLNECGKMIGGWQKWAE